MGLLDQMGILTAAIFIVAGIALQRLVFDPNRFIGENALIICANADTIFLIRDNIKHAFGSSEELEVAGFTLTDVVEVSCELSDSIVEGESVAELLGIQEIQPVGEPIIEEPPTVVGQPPPEETIEVPMM